VRAECDGWFVSWVCPGGTPSTLMISGVYYTEQVNQSYVIIRCFAGLAGLFNGVVSFGKAVKLSTEHVRLCDMKNGFVALTPVSTTLLAHTREISHI
jgi:hypothetical protein